MVSSKEASESTSLVFMEKRWVQHHLPLHEEAFIFLTIELQFQLIKCEKRLQVKIQQSRNLIIQFYIIPPSLQLSSLFGFLLRDCGQNLFEYSLNMKHRQSDSREEKASIEQKWNGDAGTTGLISLNKVPMTDLQQDCRREQMAIPNPIGQIDSNSTQLPFDGFSIPNQQSGLLDNGSSLFSQAENHSMLHSRLQVDMTAEINKYFQQCASSIRDFTAYRDKFVLVANHRVKKQIKNGEVEVSDQPEELTFKGREKMKAREIEVKRRQVQLQKQEIIRKLRTIEQEEMDLVHMALKSSRNRPTKMKKVSYTVEDKQKITEILKAKKEFELSLIQKTEEYIKNSQQLKRAEEEEYKRSLEAENLRKKQEITKRLRQMEVKSEQRKQILKKSAIKINHNYIHKKNQRNFKSLQKRAQQQKKSKLQELSARHKLNIDQINQHDRKYTELLQKRSRSLSQLKTETQNETKKYKPTYFHKVVDEELFQLKEKNYQRLMKIKEKQYQTKIMKYQEKIDQEHKPKVDPNKSIPAVPRTYSSVTLTNEERMQKGLEYLAKAKQMKRSTSEIVEQPKEVQNYGYKAYKDYLKEREPLNIDATEKQFNQILSSREHKDPNSLIRAKFLAEGLQAKSKKNGDDKLYFSMKTKLSLLSQLY